MTDCIIVGGGLIGMLSARELTKAGMKVLLIEKGVLGGESSWAGGGILSPLHPWRYSDRVNRLARTGHELYPQFAEDLKSETGIDPEYLKSGMIVLQSEEQQAALEWSKKWSMQLEIAESATSIQNIVPGINSRFSSAIWLPDIGQMRNPRLVKSLRSSLDVHQIEYVENTSVESLSVSNGLIKGVVTSEQTYHADKVLITGGAWSGQLLSDDVGQFGFEPVKGQMILFRAKPDLLKHIVLDENRYLIPRKDGRILCGSTLEYSGFDKSTSEQMKMDLRQCAVELLPELGNTVLEHHWAGLRPGSSNGEPFIGKHPETEGLFINVGHFRNGVILGIGSVLSCTKLMLD